MYLATLITRTAVNLTFGCNLTIRMLLYNNLFSNTIRILNNVRHIHLGSAHYEVQLLTRLRVVDNSKIGKRAMAEGKAPKIIHIYNKTGVGRIGK